MSHPVIGFHPEEFNRPRVGPHNLHRLANMALKNIPEAKPVIDNIFNPTPIKREVVPVQQRDLIMHTGFFSV